MLTENHQTLSSPLVTRLLIACGAIGPILFVLVLLIEGATRPGYNAWTQAGSALSLSEQGWMQITNFIVSGLLILGFTIGVRQTFRRGRGATWGSLLLGVVGVGLIIAGIFVTDPAQGYPPGTPPGPAVHTTWHGSIHFFVGGHAFFSDLPAACFVFARSFASDPQWKGWTLYAVITGIFMVAFFVAVAIASMHGGPAGLFERISIGIGMVWMALFALRLLLKMRSSVSSSATDTLLIGETALSCFSKRVFPAFTTSEEMPVACRKVRKNPQLTNYRYMHRRLPCGQKCRGRCDRLRRENQAAPSRISKPRVCWTRCTATRDT